MLAENKCFLQHLIYFILHARTAKETENNKAVRPWLEAPAESTGVEY